MRWSTMLALGAAVPVLSACGKEEEPPPVVRPVLSVVAKRADERRLVFTGLIQARYETDRGFQVLGRIVARHVNVGDIVRSGQKLAENEALTYQLAVRSSEAELARAKSEYDRVRAARGRTSTLVSGQIAPRADLDNADQQLEAATASVRQAEANLAKSRENLRYTTLVADTDGVVTAIYADIGQMASPGMRVMTVARTDIREAAVDLPEDVVRTIKPGAAVEVSLLADPSIRTPAKVREIAPQADAATRTRRVRATLEKSEDPFRLGATVNVSVTPLAQEGRSVLEVPETAILERDGKTSVWVVDAGAKTVKGAVVDIEGRERGFALVRSGLESGARVVVAGVRGLKEGQQIALDGEATR